MPRQSRRPAAPVRRSAPAPAAQQTRPASSLAHPGATAAQTRPGQQAQGSQGTGFLGQVASTAAGVAIGSTVAHSLGGLFGGGSSAVQAEQSNAVAEQGAYNNTFQAPKVCEGQVLNFRNCMDQNQGDLTICGWYLDQLKACQQAASKY